MTKVGQKIRQNVEDVKEFSVSEDDIARVIKKRKNWSAPGVDDIENLWWNVFKVCWIP